MSGADYQMEPSTSRGQCSQKISGLSLQMLSINGNQNLGHARCMNLPSWIY
jgi:hypothetical protein